MSAFRRTRLISPCLKTGVLRRFFDNFDDKRTKLDIEIPGNVLVIADLGLWYGRRSGYRELGSNVNEIFNVEASKYYCDTYDVRGMFHHHDGTNEYLFRYVPDGVDATPLLNALYYGKATHEMMLRYTRSLRPYVSKVYGWGGCQPKIVA